MRRRRRRRPRDRVARSRLQRVGRRQRGVRDARRCATATRRSSRRSTDVDYDMDTRDRDRREGRNRCSAATTASQYTSARAVGDRARRHPGADLGRAPPRHRRSTAPRPRCSTATARTSISTDPAFRVVAPVAARPRLRVRDRARARRRRDGPRVVRGRAGSSTRRTRSPTSSRAPSISIAQQLHLAGPARRARRQRGRPADGRGREPAARPVRGDRRRGAVRRRRHARCSTRRSRSRSPSGRSGATRASPTRTRA